jgi:putative membrane protein
MLTKTRLSVFASLAVLCLAPLAYAGDPGTTAGAEEAKPALAKADKDFAAKAASSGMLEVRLGELAMQKASNEAVKDLAKQKVDEHTKANEKLTTMAKDKGIEMQTELMPKHQAMHDKLAKLEGDAFDKAYVSTLKQIHKNDLTMFKKAMKSAKDPDLKSFATDTVPTLEAHLKHVDETAKMLNGKKTARAR